MGKFSSQAKALLERKIADGRSKDEAIHEIQTACVKANKVRDKEIAEIKERFDDDLPVEWLSVISAIENAKQLESDWRDEFEAFK